MSQLNGIPFFNNIENALKYMEQKELNRPLTPKEGRYYEALCLAFKDFIEEERKGQSFSSAERLMSKIKSARTLYK